MPKARGSASGRAVLTEREIPEIRGLYRGGATLRSIAGRYGVCISTIHNVLTGRFWGHVPDPEGPVELRGRYDPMNRVTRKVDWDRVAEMRRLRRDGVTCPEIAGRYGLSIHTVRSISCGRSWKAGARKSPGPREQPGAPGSRRRDGPRR